MTPGLDIRDAFTWDEDALLAGAELAMRSGASSFEFGHLEDDVPIDQARWWASVQYRGARLQVDEHRDPIEAVEALARRILRGAKCQGCGKAVSLHGNALMQASRCRWTREGRHWLPACAAGRERLRARLAAEPDEST